MPNEILHHDDETNEMARVEPSVPVSATGTTAKTANGLSQHTPGPWRVDTSFAIPSVIAPYYPKGAVCVAVVYGGMEPTLMARMPQVDEATEANARLIAAAPELLLSVKELVALYAGTRDMLGPSVQAKLARAEAAIQKAGAQ